MKFSSTRNIEITNMGKRCPEFLNALCDYAEELCKEREESIEYNQDFGDFDGKDYSFAISDNRDIRLIINDHGQGNQITLEIDLIDFKFVCVGAPGQHATIIVRYNYFKCDDVAGKAQLISKVVDRLRKLPIDLA